MEQDIANFGIHFSPHDFYIIGSELNQYGLSLLQHARRGHSDVRFDSIDNK